MSTVPLIPDTAPFTPEQRAWLNGFFAGIFSRSSAPEISNLKSRISNAGSSAALVPLTILWGSQTGTAESLAKRAAKEAGRRNFAATVLDMAQTDLAKLAAEKNLLVITSTFGDGEPPDNAKALHAVLTAAAKEIERGEGAATPGATDGGATPSSRKLSGLRFSVCGLGDTNYTHFNQCAKDFDALLDKLGAVRVAPRVDCDLDYEEKFNAWLVSALDALGATLVPADSVAGVADPGLPGSASPATTKTGTSVATPTPEPAFSRQNPFPALLLSSRSLNGAGSAKQVHHVEFDLTGSDLVYEAGDALGIYAHNCPELVQDVLAALACDGEEAVPAPDGNTTSLRRALTEIYDLGKPTPELIGLAGACLQATRGTGVSPVIMGGTPMPLPASASEPIVSDAPHHVIDVLLAVPGAKLAPADFVRTLKKLQPRLYSISSSPKAHAGQVHLTVGALRYEKDARSRKGVCSTFLADRAQPGTTRIGVFIHTNKTFRPPANGDTPAIMVGPGTGIAPFRAFLHERRAAGAKGKNWLFFGDQRAATDFLYRDELAALMREGVLTRLDTAFSRDQPEKIYVQRRMLENAAELYAWLEAGAHFYVCGDASRMAKDVEVALHRAIEIAGGKTAEQAADYVQALKTAKRYARDVY